MTEFETAEGVVELIDFVGSRHGFSDLVRLVRGVVGRVPMLVDLRGVTRADSEKVVRL